MTNATKKLFALVDADIDHRIKEAKAAGVSPVETAAMDKVLRPTIKLMEIQKAAEADPDEFLDAMFWIMAVISVEVIMNTTDKTQPDQVYARMNDKIKDYSESVSRMLAASVPQLPPASKRN